MAEQLLTTQHPNIAELTLVPSSGGIFEVHVEESIIFSKKDLGRFPEDGEIERLFGKSTGQ